MHKSLLFSLLIGNVILRLFTNYLNILPRIFNVWDIFIVVLLALSFFLGAKDHRRTQRGLGPIMAYLIIFNILGITGTLLNTKYIYPLSALSQLVMWNEPIVLFLVLVYARFTLDDIHWYVSVFIKLIKIELVVGVLQIYNYMQTGQSEDIKGTFYHNAEQYQAFVLIGVFYLLGRLELPENKHKLRDKIAIVGILCLVILIDNKASWITTGLTLLYLFMKMPSASEQLKVKAKYVAAFAAILCLGYIVVTSTSTSNASQKYGQLLEAWDTGNVTNIGKIKAYGDVLDAYSNYPHMIVFGSGLGTFYSRAAWQFMPPSIEEIYSQPIVVPTQDAGYKESNSMGGVITPVTDIEPFYRHFYKVRKIFPIGSGTVDFPPSTYVSLLGETGVVATVLYLSIYFRIWKRFWNLWPVLSSDPRFMPFAVATAGFFVYLILMGTYNFWLEDARLATILWSMVAMVFKYVELKGTETSAKTFVSVQNFPILLNTQSKSGVARRYAISTFK